MGPVPRLSEGRMVLLFSHDPARCVVSIGECMIELSRQSDGRFSLGYGGDTFNTAIYLARLGTVVAYATLLGDDPYSGEIAALAAREGIATGLIGIAPGRNAGLYMIETTPKGERSFRYWRDRAPARELFNGEHGLLVAAAMNDARVVYLSGITLSLYDAAGLDKLEAAIRAARLCGARVAVDGNYRPAGWGGAAGRPRAQAAFERFFRLADLAMPTYDDEQALWGDTEPQQTLTRLRAWGVQEVVLKRGPEGALVASDGVATVVPIPSPVEAIDTTAAGDSFNAAYLAGRLKGAAPSAAALAGHKLAGAKIRHRGAIMPKEAMPVGLV